MARVFLGAVVLSALVVSASGCRGGSACVPVARTTSGEPRQTYDEFTQITWLTSWFVLTPDQEWERVRREPESTFRWSIEMWLRAASNVPYIDVTLRGLCSRRQPDNEDKLACVNCDDVCNDQTGGVEFLADNVPVPMPSARYERVPIGAPEGGGPKTWASTMTLRLSPLALAPLERARSVKLRVCGRIAVTLRPSELGNLQNYLRHHHAIAPPESGAPPASGVRASFDLPPPQLACVE
jgi:hypothetical protein